MAKISASGVVAVLVLLAMVCSSFVDVVEAAKIETFNGRSCTGNPTNTFFVGGNTCQNFNDQGAVQISEVSSNTRVSVHNTGGCPAVSQVAQIFGPGCVVQGATALNAVFIA